MKANHVPNLDPSRDMKVVQSCVLQVVVQGIPWKFRDEDLVALFQECGTVEEAKVVLSKDGRSRVRPCGHPFEYLQSICDVRNAPFGVGAERSETGCSLPLAGLWHCALQRQGGCK